MARSVPPCRRGTRIASVPGVKLGFHLELCQVLARPFGAALRTLQRDTRCSYRPLTEPEALAWCDDPELELRPDQVQAAFVRGDLCLGAFDGERLVGYVWLAFEPAPHTGGVWVHFHPRARYSYKKFVRPAYRGRKVAHGLSALGDAPVFVRGRQFSINFVSVLNRASLKSSRRSGSRSVGYAGILRCGKLSLPFRSPGARGYGFRFAVDVARAPAPRPLSRASSRG
jgi:GNAT superfamily N-acetyltransferase